MGRPRRRIQDSPIDSRQKDLAEQEEQLRRKREELERLIEDAPLARKEIAKRQQQDLVIRASQPSRRAESPGSLFDKRYDANVAAIPRKRRKSLRAEQQAVRLRTLALFAFFLAVIFIIWAKFLH